MERRPLIVIPMKVTDIHFRGNTALEVSEHFNTLQVKSVTQNLGKIRITN